MEELAGYLKMQVYCRVPVAEIGSHTVIKTSGSTQTEGTSGLQKFVASWWRRRTRNATTQRKTARTSSHPLHLLKQSSF